MNDAPLMVNAALLMLENEIVRVMGQCGACGELVIYNRKIAKDLGLPKDMASALLKGLRTHGYVVYCRGLFDDDGNPAGSGYTLTGRGVDRFESLEAAR